MKTKTLFRPKAGLIAFALSLSPFGVSSVARAAQVPAALSLGGELFDAAGSPIHQSSVNFRVRVYDAAETCVLYSETHLGQDLSNTLGRFDLILGAGSSIVNNVDGSQALNVSVFANPGAVTVASCGSVNLNPGDVRSIHIDYDLGLGQGYASLSPGVAVVSSPYALVAETLGGLDKSAFLQVSNNGSSSLSQTNAEYAFSGVNWPKLKALVDGTSAAYLPTTPTAAVDLNGQRLTDLHDPTAAQDAATKHYADANLGGSALDLTAVGPMIGGGSTLMWDQTANKWVAGAFSAAPTGAAGGDLSGTYPNPTLANGAVTAAKISTTGGGVNRLLITDATTGAAVGFGTCAVGEVYAWTATGFACTSGASLSPVQSVAGKTGAVILNAADIAGLGTAALYDYGTAAGQIPRLDGAGKLAALDGSQLTNVNAVSLQSRAVASTAPSAGQVLGWNSATAQWMPITAAAGSVTSVGSGNGLLGGPITGAGTLSVDTGTTANKVLQLNAGAQIPAVDGSLLTQVNAVFLQSRPLAATLPTAGQVMGWNNASLQWEPTSVTTGTVVGLSTGTGLLGGPITTTGTISVDVGYAAGKIAQENANAQIAQGAGSAALPSFSFVNSASTGLFSPGTNQLALATNGTAALNIAANGLVGIGTSTPAQSLDVVGNEQVSGNLILKGLGVQFVNFGSLPALQTTAANGPTQFNLIPGGSSTNAQLSIFGNPYFGTTNYSTLAQNADALDLNNAALTGNSLMTFSMQGARVMTLTSGGRVGVGTSAPQAGLDLALTGTASSALLIPRDTTGNRPIGVNGMLRYNSSLGMFEGFANGAWSTIAAGSSAGSVTNISAGGGLLGGPITTTGTLSVDVGTAASKIVQENANAQIAQSAGAAALPAYAFVGSPSTGVFSPGANQLALSTNGTAALNIAANGFVGIGTAAPASALDLNGGTLSLFGSSGATIGADSGGTLTLSAQGAGVNINYAGGARANFSNDISLAALAPNAIHLKNGANETMTVLSGYVGINSTAPLAALDINATGSSSAIIIPRDIASNRPAGVNGMLRYNTTANAFEGYAGGAWSTIVSGSGVGTVTNIATGLGLLGGPVTTTGTLSVDVGAAAGKIVQENANAQILQLNGTSALPSYSFVSSPSTGMFSPAANQLSLATNGTAALTILAGGYVGVGTTAPRAAIDVVATGSASAVIVPRDTTGNRPAGVNGMLRYNTTANAIEAFVNGQWVSMATQPTGSTTPVNASGPPVNAGTYAFSSVSGNFTPGFGSIANTYNGNWPVVGSASNSNSNCVELDTSVTSTAAIVYDLGANRTIGNVYVSSNGPPYGYMQPSLSFSTDGTTYNTSMNVNMGNNQTIQYTATALSTSITARYIKLVNGGNSTDTSANARQYNTFCQLAVGP